MTLKNNKAPLQRYFKLCASFGSHLWIQTRVTVRKRPIWVKIDFFRPGDLAIWRMSLKNNRAPFLCCFKLSHHFITIGECKLELQSGKAQFGSQFNLVTSKFDLWPCKTTGHLFYATSCFAHHFVAIGELKLELQSGNAQSGSNSAIFWAVWPWNLTNDIEIQ